jgi:asparagine synthase (glutamine-hydrolysing)
VELSLLRRMLGMIRHRGPDEFGIYRDNTVGLGNARLSIIDLTTGQQPICNEDGTVCIVFNGEIFNYVELRCTLEENGHHFTTTSDTEVLLHLYEDCGPGCLRVLNGQFAIAIWDSREGTLFLARDRVGIRPLFYTETNGQLVFASEIKALLTHPEVGAEIDPASLEQVFTYWSTLSPRTAFRDISEIPPGHYMLAWEGKYTIQPYWTHDFSENTPVSSKCVAQDCLEQFKYLLIDAARIRLRADVPVGAYLSGGLDSSVTAAIIRNYSANKLDTFSIAFEDLEFDESPFQQQMADMLDTNHQVVYCTSADVGKIFPDVIWHTETPILRTSPAPMFMLSKLVQDHNYKVVLTGEGADEILAGYNIFKETKVRRFWAKDPESKLRPLLLQRLYPYISGLSDSQGAYLTAFFGKGLSDTESPYYSHAIRWSNTARIRRFLLRDQPGAQRVQGGAHRPAPLPPYFETWSPLAQAQYLEMTIFLSQYLLSSQGDRMLMAHSVEGRFPFLDHRVVEFCNSLPPRMKLRGLTEKWLLKQLGRKLVPPDIWQRPKQPYRAPIHHSFFNRDAPDYVQELLSEPALRASGFFKPGAVARLVRKAQQHAGLSEVEDMALVGILSTQLLHHHFVDSYQPSSIEDSSRLKVVDWLSIGTTESVAL